MSENFKEEKLKEESADTKVSEGEQWTWSPVKILGWVAVVIVAVLIGLFWWMNSNLSDDVVVYTDQNPPIEEESTNTTDSIADLKLIFKNLFADKYDKDVIDIDLVINADDLAFADTHIRGSVCTGPAESDCGNFYGVLVADDWQIVIDGIGVIPCELLNDYDFPAAMTDNCTYVGEDYMDYVNPPSDNWLTYENTELGFSINYPKVNYNGYEVKIINADPVIYIVPSERQEEEIEEKRYSESVFDRAFGIPYAILVQEVNNDEELDDFIKQRYGTLCALGEKTESEQSGVYDISIDSSNWIPGDYNSCFVNYVTKIKYSPSLNKIASWDIGQSDNFSSDPEISNSFQFTDQETSSDWQTYSNQEWGFSFEYPSDWDYLNEMPAGVEPNYVGYLVTVGVPGEYNGVGMPSVYVGINPDGYGPFFYDKTIILEKNSSSLSIIEENEVERTEYHDDNIYFISALTDQHDNESDRYSFKFQFAAGNNNESDLVIERILDSFEFTN
jgi:hypothetical protein